MCVTYLQYEQRLQFVDITWFFVNFWTF